MRVAEREQTVAEEIMNALSHGLGLLLAIASLPILLGAGAAERGGGRGARASSRARDLLYRVSTLYHALPLGRAKAWFNRLDQRPSTSSSPAATCPSCSACCAGPGAGRCSARSGRGGAGRRGQAVQPAAASAVVDRPLRRDGLDGGGGRGAADERMSGAGLAWLVAGGLAYTAGAVVFLFDSKLRFAHFVWHLFVLAGSACHFFAVLWHAHG